MAATTGGPLALLKTQSEVRIDPKFPLRSYLSTATRIKEMAEKADRNEEHAAAYVGYRKVAGLLKVVVDHPDFKEMARKKESDYYKYSDLKARVLPITHRCRELEEILSKVEMASADHVADASHSPNTTSVQDMLAAMPAELNHSEGAPKQAQNPTAAAPADGPHTPDWGASHLRLQQGSLSHGSGTFPRSPPPIPPTSSKPASVASPVTPSFQSVLSPTAKRQVVPIAHLDASNIFSNGGTSADPKPKVLHQVGPKATPMLSQMSNKPPTTITGTGAADDSVVANVSVHSHKISGSLKARMNALYSAGMNAAAEHGDQPTVHNDAHSSKHESNNGNDAHSHHARAPPLADTIGQLVERPESAPVAGTVASYGPIHSDASELLTHHSAAQESSTMTPHTNSSADVTSPTTLGLDSPFADSPSRFDFEQRFPDLEAQSGIPNGSPLTSSPSSPNFARQPAPTALHRDDSPSASRRSTILRPFHPAPTGPLGLPSQYQKPTSHEASPPNSSKSNRLELSVRPARGPLPKLPLGPSLPNISSASITPLELWRFIETALSEQTPRYSILLLDVRSRREYESGRVKGDTVCIEPFTLSSNSTAFSISNSLVVCPDAEQKRFSKRSGYDLIVLYDRASREVSRKVDSQVAARSGPMNGALPSLYGPSLGIGAQPAKHSDPDSRALSILASAIYELNFSDEQNRLRRSPLVLKGGWEAWVREIGEKGINRQASVGLVPRAAPAASSHDTPSTSKEAEYQAMLTNRHAHANSDDPLNGVQLEAKRAHRKAVLSGDGYIIAPSAGVGDSSQAYQAYPATSIAIPPVAVHRTGPASPYEAYPTPSIQASMANAGPRSEVPYFEKPLQSNGHNYQLPTFPNSAIMNGSALPNHSIDYPMLQNRHRVGEGSPSKDINAPRLLGGHSAVQIPQPALARLPSSSFIAPTGAQSFQLLQNASYLTNPAHGAFPKQLYAFGDGTIGLTGLKNLGNTCYMSSVIQCLSATIPLARFLKEGSYKKAVNKTNPLGTKGVLADTVAQLIQSLWSQQYSFLAPVTFREAICRFAPQFKGSDQHDSQEFLAFLLDGLHEDLNLVVQKPPPIEFTPEREAELEALPTQIAAEREWNIYLRRDDSIIVRLLQGQYRSRLRCLTCGTTSTTYNTFMYLSLPIPTGKGITQVTLGQCLSLFTQPEILDGGDAWNCSKCKRPRRATKELTISRLPAILLIHLKRFSFTPPFTTRIDSQVSFPIRGLDMTSYMPAPLDTATKRQYSSVAGSALDDPPPPIYDLHAVSNHFGSLSSGHYTAFVKNRGDWFELNDQKIINTTESNVALAGKSSYTLWFSRRIT